MYVCIYLTQVHVNTVRIYFMSVSKIIGEGTRASESQNPATPLSQGNEEVGVGLNIVTVLLYYFRWQVPSNQH